MKSQLLGNGSSLRYRDLGEGVPLVLLHGWAYCAEVFEPLLPLLGDFRLLVPDLPGHGLSEPLPRFDSVSICESLEDWLHLVAPGPVHLLGWSLGGQLAMALCLRRSLEVHRLILCSTTPRFVQDECWDHALPAGQLRSMQRNLRRAFEPTVQQFRDGICGTPCSLALPDPANAAQGLELLGCLDQRSLLPDLKLPTLVLHGSCDPVIPFAAGQALAQALPAASLVVFEGGGHAPFMEEPRIFADHLKAFLS